MTDIVSRASEKPALATMSPFPKPVIRPGEPIRFAYEVIAAPGPGQSKTGVIISPRPDYSSWEVRCDEGTGMGGDDAAPSPLGYLIMGVAFCLLTHIQEYLRRIDEAGTPMQIDSVRVELRAEYVTLRAEPNIGLQGVGDCDAYTAHVIIHSPEPQAKLEDLIKVCRDACMAIATVAKAVPTQTRVFVNGTDNGVVV